MRELITREHEGGEVLVRSDPERVIDVRLLKWGEVASTPEGRERIARGAFRGTRPETVALEAIGPHGADPGVRLVGRATSIEEREDGPYASFRVSRTAAGDEMLELVRDGVYRNVSIVAEPISARTAPDGVTERTRLGLLRVGVVERGAYASANVLAVRSAEMTEEPQPKPVPDPEPKPTGSVTVISRSEDGALDALRSEMFGRMAALEAGRGPNGTAPLARFASFGAFVDASYNDPDAAPLLARALVDQLTTDNPGVIQPAWVTDIKGILARPRPAIQALGGARSLGSSGMELDWPYLDPALDLDTIVGKQAAEKTEITSVKVKILKGSNPIETYAGGSDVSYQLIRRSSPAYREAYLRILAIAYARTTEAAFEVAIEAAATGTAVLGAAADANAVRAFLFAASDAVEQATGAPASVDLVASDEFARLGGLQDLAPRMYGTNNISGTADAATLKIDISGLPIVKCPFLTSGTHLVTNSEAAAWHEDGPFPISAEDVAKLGQNVAIWGMGTEAVFVPAGIVKNSLVTGLSAQRRSGKE
jgi:HK97 family phage prohead protease